MALPKISVDDSNFDALFDVLRKQIPGDQWSDHNPSDPGIMLLELLAWLGEMSLYRMDRVPGTHTDKFLKLIVDPPEPSTVLVTFELQPDTTETGDVNIPAGTRLASDFSFDADTELWTRHVYETITTAIFRDPRQNADPKTITVAAREHTVVREEILGESDGTANQVFELRPSRSALGVDAKHPLPVLLDFVNAIGPYDPNPVVSVDGVNWELRQFLLTGESLVPDTPGAVHEHFMVEPYDDLVRFGDGRFGSIPAAGTVIRAERYQVLLGPDSMVRSGDLQHIVDAIPNVAGTETLTFSHTDALGGSNYFPDEQRAVDGLAGYHRRFRLITDGDFRAAMLEDFNDYQQVLGAEERVLRVVALMNRRPPLNDDVHIPGHVTLMILADDPTRFSRGLDEILRDPVTLLTDKQDAVDLTQEFVERIDAFLDRRRLITTRLRYENPTLFAISLTTRIVIDSEREIESMRAKIESSLRDYLHPLRGGDQSDGWPLGGAVYRSRLFRLIEELDGVDHVDSLTLGPANPDGDVNVLPQALPLLDSLNVVVERA